MAVVAFNKSPSLNLTKNSTQLNESLINTRFIAQKKKDKRHISFLDAVKFYYFDLEQPVSIPQADQLEMKYVNYSERKEGTACVLETFNLKNYHKNTLDKLIRLEGSVIVRNLSYNKKVTVRYTLTDWKTFTDIESFFIDSVNADWDRFAFVIRLDPVLFTSRDSIPICMAVRYETDKFTFWDNNFGNNHCFIINIRK